MSPPAADPDAQHVSPDCKVRKHDACTGAAWDHDLEVLTDCECECHSPGTAP